MILEFSPSCKVPYFEKWAKCVLTTITRLNAVKPKTVMRVRWGKQNAHDTKQSMWIKWSQIGFEVSGIWTSSEIVSQQSGAEGGILKHSTKEKKSHFYTLHHLFWDLRDNWKCLLSALIAESPYRNVVARAEDWKPSIGDLSFWEGFSLN